MPFLPPPDPNLPFLAPAFGDHMVLQRGKPNTFWGWTTPGARVRVTVADRTATGTAGRDGRWSARLLPPRTGGPYTVSIDGTEHRELTDVLVGDVWLCTGQSNMEFGLTLERGGAEAVAAANDPNLRLYIAGRQPTLRPMATNTGSWAVCTPESVAQGGWGGFSAVGYHFGARLRREIGVPIGLVEDVWGGTNAESWISPEGLRPLREFDAALANIATADPNAPTDGSNDPGSQPGSNWGAIDLDTKGWRPVAVPNGFTGLGLDAYDGTAWFRREFTLAPAQAAGTATLALGTIDDADVVWLNGVQVAAGSGWDRPRRYVLPAGALRAGRNVLAVRVLDTGNGGGFGSAPEVLRLETGDGGRVPLAGTWLGHVGAALPVSGPNVPTALSNGMIEPIVPLAIRGAIWYQGENNASRAAQYRRVLPALIGDWRRRFGQGDFPFYIVSLAAFGPRRDVPGDDEWAELREAQALTATKVRNSGLAVTIDVGDAADIHPAEKRTVGERLARLALRREYARRVEDQGPTFRDARVEGGAVRVRFDHAEGGLVVRGPGPNAAPGEFAIAGADRKWHVATARLDGTSVVVSSPEVPRPVAVRYAWQTNPLATLFNRAGLPAVPFRTDAWPLLTTGRE